MRSRLLLLFSVALFAVRAFATTGYIQVSGSGLQDANGNLVANATIIFSPVNSSGAPMSFQVNGSGQATTRPIQAQVTAGAFTVQLADVYLTNPKNVCYSVTVIDKLTGRSVLGPGYGCVQPSSQLVSGVLVETWCSPGSSVTCDFDDYPPNLPAMAPVLTGPQGLTGASGPNCSVSSPPGTCDLGIVTAESFGTVRSADHYCTTSGTLDQSCFNNALAANTIIQVPAGTYTVSSTVTVSQANVTLDCLPGVTFLNGSGSAKLPMFVFTGAGPIIRGCNLNSNNVALNATGDLVFNGASNVIAQDVTQTNANITVGYGIFLENVNGAILRNVSTSLLQLAANGASIQNIDVAGGKLGTLLIEAFAPGGATSNVNVSGVNLAPPPSVDGGQGDCITAGDFSTSHNGPIAGLHFQAINCTLAGSSSGAPFFGAFSFPSSNTTGLTMDGVTVTGSGQYISTALLETGCVNCQYSHMTFEVPDAYSQAYQGILNYGADSKFDHIDIEGWGATAKGVLGYPQTASGAAFNGDRNQYDYITLNNQVLSNSVGHAFDIECNVSGSSSLLNQIDHLQIVGPSAKGEIALVIASPVGSGCPVSATVSDVKISNFVYGLYFPSPAVVDSGVVTYNSVTNQYVAGTVFATRSFDSPIAVDNGTTVVYRCTTAGTLPIGALTTTAANCGASVDVGLRTQ